MEITDTIKKIDIMSVDEARKWLAGQKEGEFILLDVRQPEEYRSGHLPGAEFIPLPELLERMKELDPAKPLLVYCRRGNRSRSAAALLSSEEFVRVYSLQGGIMAWEEQVATGDYREGMSLLEGRETAEELISLAWALEEGSRAFYERASELSSDKEAKDLFNALMEAEAKHKTNILEAYGFIIGKSDMVDPVKRDTLRGVMEGGVQVEDVTTFLNEQNRTLQDILEVSMQVETNALDLYIKMFREIVNENVRKVFSSLIEEEKRHLSRLGRLLGSRVA